MAWKVVEDSDDQPVYDHKLVRNDTAERGTAYETQKSIPFINDFSTDRTDIFTVILRNGD